MSHATLYEWVVGSRRITEALPFLDHTRLEIVPGKPFLFSLLNNAQVPAHGEHWQESYPVKGERLTCPLPEGLAMAHLMLMHARNATVIAITDAKVHPKVLLADYQDGEFDCANYITLLLPSRH